MAITRREFVTRMGALAAAAGISQADISKLAEAFGGHTTNLGGTHGKPRVIWVHGAECTGCSTSLLSFLEDLNGKPLYNNSTVTTADALALAGVNAAPGGTLGGAAGSLTLSPTSGIRTTLYGAGSTDEGAANIADVVIDVVDIQYHETIMGMGGDLAAQWLKDFADYTPVAGGSNPGDVPFVLVVEGALQDKTQGGAWNDAAGNGKSWCSIGMSDDGQIENDMAEIVVACATKSTCVGIIPIGQCATYGGYPACKPQITEANAGGFNPALSQTGALGTYDYLKDVAGVPASVLNKVVNVPGCPTNPWWFCLTVVLFMINLTNPATAASLGLMNKDYGKRLKAVYPIPVHSAWCPHYGEYNKGIYATKVGDPGCLQKIGCKGLSTYSLCGLHGWNNQQPQNAGSLASLNNGKGGHCTTAGHPCMGCTEKGYPDSFVPFVKK